MRRHSSILIGIPSFQRPKGLRALLDSLATQQGVDEARIELFVADNDPARREAFEVCGARSSEFRWPLKCRVVADPGISAARNAILKYARERNVDFIAMLDDDETVSNNWLCQMLATQARFNADVVGGPVFYDFEEEPSAAVRNCGMLGTRLSDEGLLPRVDATNNVLLKRASLESVGWPTFDASFGLTGGGDTEFFTRLQKNGLRFAWSPAAVAREVVPKDRSQASWIIRRAFRVGNSNMRIAQMHQGAFGSSVSLAKAIVLLATAPFCAPLLIVPSRRLWIITKWAKSVGKFAALVGRHYDEYARVGD